MPFELPKIEAIRAPFAGKSPQGEDPKHAPEFFLLQSEIENIASGRADWEKIELQSAEILAEKSKDLRALGFLGAALVRRHGLEGLVCAVELVECFVNDHWEGVHPEQSSRRGSALEWVTLRVPDYIDALETTEDDRATLETLNTAIRALNGDLRKKLGPDAPSFLPLSGPIEEQLARLGPKPAEASTETPVEEASPPSESEPTKPPEPSPAKAAESDPQSPAATSGGPDPAKPESAKAGTAKRSPATARGQRDSSASSELPEEKDLAPNATVLEIKNRVRALVPFLRQADPGSPLSYRLSRLLKWSELTSPPPLHATKGGNATQIAVPRQEQRQSLESLVEKKNWAGLLEVAEGTFQSDSGTFWLDLQRYSVLALDGLACSAASEVVISELRGLLDRVPSLIRLEFSSGEIPFASPETRRWIEESVRKMDLGSLQIGVGASAASMLDETAVDEVRGLLGKKNLAGALSLLQDAIDRAPNASSRFQTRLMAAHLCLEANRLPWARNLLEDLAREAEAFDFESWEPETAVQLFQLQALCFGKLSKAAEGEEAERLREDLAEAQARLFRLDLRPIATIEHALGDDAPRSPWWRLRK